MSKHLPSTLRSRLSEERGVALILTLAIIALVTLLLIAFVTSMRVENAASKNFNDLVKSRELALGAVDQAVASIRQATTRSLTVTNYVTFPGVIYDYNGATRVTTAVKLYSDNTADPTNLNSGSWITGTNGEFLATLPAGSQINAGWLYVAEDGTVGPSPLSGHGAIVGRYAFWTDDEASKININSAGVPTAGDAYGTSVSNDVDLSVLLPPPYLSVPAITTRQTTFGFTTPEEIKLADTSVSDFTANQFSTTTYSRDANYPTYADDLDIFGRPRLVISTLQDPGDLTAGGSATNTYNRLADTALAFNGMGLYGGNFLTKYPNLSQIIANIMAYQIVDLTKQWPPADYVTLPPLAPTYVGLAKVPYINELNVAYDFEAASPGPGFTVQRKVSVELIYQYDSPFAAQAGLDKVVVSGLADLGAGLANTVTIDAGAASFAATTLGTPLYKVVSFSDPGPPPNVGSGPTALPSPLLLTVKYTRDYAGKPGAFLNFAQTQIGAENAVTIPGKVDDGAEVNDPAVNMTSSQWHVYKTGHNTLGVVNSVYAPSETPPSKTVIRGGPMQSIGELGYIHAIAPWTYLTLQPNATPGTIPDWAMLDFFTTGTPAPQTAGRININSFINPGLGTPAPSTQRLVPLKALLNSLTPPATVAGNIYTDTRVNLDTYGMKDPATSDPIFDTIGEVCEATGVADTGANAAAKEAIIRRIANLITVRSSTFTVWVMAQSIKQPPGSTLGTFDQTKDLITGEVRAQAVVERYESAPGAAGSVPKFRTRYFRYLYN